MRRLLKRCLDRDPKLRLRDIGEARIELQRIESGSVDGVATVPSAGSTLAQRTPIWWIAATTERRAWPETVGEERTEGGRSP